MNECHATVKYFTQIIALVSLSSFYKYSLLAALWCRHCCVHWWWQLPFHRWDHLFMLSVPPKTHISYFNSLLQTGDDVARTVRRKVWRLSSATMNVVSGSWQRTRENIIRASRKHSDLCIVTSLFRSIRECSWLANKGSHSCFSQVHIHL